MNTEELNYFEEQISIRCRGVTERVARIYRDILEIISNNPKIEANTILTRLEIPVSTGYRYLADLRKSGLLTKDYTLAIPKYNRNFRLPPALRQGILPPVGYNATHLISLLSQYKDDQIPVGWSMTKAEILEKIREKLTKDADLAQRIVCTIQNYLAMYALFVGDCTQWEHMVGAPFPPTNINEVFQ